VDEGAPDGEVEWPDEGDEASFLSESASRPRESIQLAPRQAPAAPAEKLPALEELVGRVPPAVMALLDDLFRAKFTAVRKFSAADNAPGVTTSARQPGS
jgi:hypothetical protein